MSISNLLVLIGIVLIVLALLSLLGIVLEGAALALLVVGALLALAGFAIGR